MPARAQLEKIDAADAGHTVERCRRALAAAPAGNTIYAAYWEKQLGLAEQRAAVEEAKRKEVFG